jgi:hypothetical protein
MKTFFIFFQTAMQMKILEILFEQSIFNAMIARFFNSLRIFFVRKGVSLSQEVLLSFAERSAFANERYT